MKVSSSYLKTSDKVIVKPEPDGDGWRWYRIRQNNMNTGRESSKELVSSDAALADARSQNPDVTKFEQQNDW